MKSFPVAENECFCFTIVSGLKNRDYGLKSQYDARTGSCITFDHENRNLYVRERPTMSKEIKWPGPGDWRAGVTRPRHGNSHTEFQPEVGAVKSGLALLNIIFFCRAGTEKNRAFFGQAV